MATTRRVVGAAAALVIGVTLTAGVVTRGHATAVPAAPVTALKIMPLGDSITAGVGSTTHSGYRTALYNRLTAAGIAVDFVGSQNSGVGPDTANEGHSGWTIAQLAAQADGWLATTKPDVVLLHAGTNDIERGPDVSLAAPARLAELIDQIRADLPAAQIFVAMLISARTPVFRARIAAFNAAVPAIVMSKGPMVHLVDQSAVGGLDLHDTLHPNDVGYAKMAYTWFRAMETVYRACLPPRRPCVTP
jgi:lysophospholipase L1-like esterase